MNKYLRHRVTFITTQEFITICNENALACSQIATKYLEEAYPGFSGLDAWVSCVMLLTSKWARFCCWSAVHRGRMTTACLENNSQSATGAFSLLIDNTCWKWYTNMVKKLLLEASRLISRKHEALPIPPPPIAPSGNKHFFPSMADIFCQNIRNDWEILWCYGQCESGEEILLRNTPLDPKFLCTGHPRQHYYKHRTPVFFVQTVPRRSLFSWIEHIWCFEHTRQSVKKGHCTVKTLLIRLHVRGHWIETH